MKQFIIIILALLVMACSVEKKLLKDLENGIYSLEAIELKVPDGIKIEPLDERAIELINISRDDSNSDNYSFKISSSVDTIAISYPFFYTFIDENYLYDGKIEIYKLDGKNMLELEEVILPPFRKKYYKDDYIHTGYDFRTLSENIKIHEDYLLADIGYRTHFENNKGYENISKEEAFKKIKETNLFTDDVYLYKKNSEWELVQTFKADFGNDYERLKNYKDELSYYPPFFGEDLNITNDYCMIYNSQTTRMNHFYEKNSVGLFEEKSRLPMQIGGFMNSDMSGGFTIYNRGKDAEGFFTMPVVNILNNESKVIEANLKSPIQKHPYNKNFGKSFAITENLAFISEPTNSNYEKKYDIDIIQGTGLNSIQAIKINEENNDINACFPGYLHVYKRTDEGRWLISQTITSPLGANNEVFGNIVIANDKNVVVVSQPKYYFNSDVKPLARFIYIYSINEDLTLTLSNMFYDLSEIEENYIQNLNFFNNGIIFSENEKSIRFIPDLFNNQ